MKAWNGKKLKKQIREKFPSIFRYIPELQSDLSIVHIRQYWFITLIVSCYCLLIFSLVIIGKRTADDFLYVTHLTLEYQLGNMKLASSYAQKALYLDPTYREALIFQEYIKL